MRKLAALRAICQSALSGLIDRIVIDGADPNDRRAHLAADGKAKASETVGPDEKPIG